MLQVLRHDYIGILQQYVLRPDVEGHVFLSLTIMSWDDSTTTIITTTTVTSTSSNSLIYLASTLRDGEWSERNNLYSQYWLKNVK